MNPHRYPTLPLILVALALLWAFLAASGPIQWGDNGAFIADAATGPLLTRDFGPLSHPFYHGVTVAFQRVYGLESLAYLNVLLLVPLSYALYRLACALGAKPAFGWLAAAAAIFSHGIFWIATKAEVYLLHTLLMVAAYGLVLASKSRPHKVSTLVLLGVLTGLGAATHQLTFIVLLPLYLALLVAEKSRILYVLPGFLVGVAPCYPGLFDRLVQGDDVFHALRFYLTGASGAANGGWESSFLRLGTLLQEKSYVLILLLSLAGIQALGFLTGFGNRRKALLGWAATLDFLFALTYGVSDRFTFFLPGTALLCVLAFSYLSERLEENRGLYYGACLSPLISPLLLLSVYTLDQAGAITLPRQPSPLPFRDDVRYFLAPYLREDSAERFVVAYEEQVPAGGTVLADWTPLKALEAAQADGRFQGRELLPCAELRNPALGDHAAFYLVRKEYCEVSPGYREQPLPIGYRLEREVPTP